MEMRALVRNDVFSGDYATVRIPLQTGGMADTLLPQKRLSSEEESRCNSGIKSCTLGRSGMPTQNSTYTVIEFVGVGGDAVSIFVDEGPVHRQMVDSYSFSWLEGSLSNSKTSHIRGSCAMDTLYTLLTPISRGTKRKVDPLHEFKVEIKVNGAATHFVPRSGHRRNRFGLAGLEFGVAGNETNKLYWMEDGWKFNRAHCPSDRIMCDL